MARVVVKNNTIQAKLVYYGPGLCGKTTNLQWVNRHLAGGEELMSLATEGDRTIFFDFMPLDLGKLRGMDVQFKLYTVPGQVRYNQTRKMVLKNVDGIVFVADSQPQMVDANLESLDNLFANLVELGINHEQVAIVLQYNKRDLPAVLPPEALDAALNTQKKYPTFLASAHSGEGVVETLKEACRLVLLRLAAQLPDTGRIKADLAATSVPSSRPSTTISGAQSAGPRKAGMQAPPAPAAGPPAMVAAAPQAIAAHAIQAVPRTIGHAAVAAEPRAAAVADAPAAPALAAALPDLQAQAELSAALQRALADAKALVGELKSELASVRAERARATSSDQLAMIASQMFTKADLQSAKRDLPGKEDVRVLRDGLALLATQADVQAGKEATASAFVEITKALGTMKQELSSLGKAKPAPAPAENAKDALEPLLGRLATRTDVEGLLKKLDALHEKPSAAPTADPVALADLAALRKQLESLHERVAELLSRASEPAAVAAPDACDPLPTKADMVALAERLNQLPTRADLQAAGKGAGAAVQAESRALAQMLTGVAQSSDVAALEKKVQALAAELAELAAKTPRDDAQASAKRALSEAPKLPESDTRPAQADDEGAPASAQTSSEPAPASAQTPEAPAEASAQVENQPAAAAEPAKDEPPPPEEAARDTQPKQADTPAPAADVPLPAPAAPPEEPPKPEIDEYAGNRDHQNAARIARVMMADLYLYNKEQVDAGIANNDFYERNTEAIADMRLTYESRVKPEVRSARDYLQVAIDEFIKKKKKQLGLDA